MTGSFARWQDFIAPRRVRAPGRPAFALDPDDLARLDDDNLDAGLALAREAGLDVQAMAAAFAMTPRQVTQRLNGREAMRLRLPSGDAAYPLGREEEHRGEQFIRYLQAGATFREAQKRTGLKLGTCRGLVQRARRDGKLAPQQGRVREKADQALEDRIAALHRPHSSIAETARQAGCSYDVARRILGRISKRASKARERTR